MNKFARAFVLMLAAAATTLSVSVDATHARDREWREGGRHHHRDYKPRRGHKQKHHHGRDAAVGGAIGLATGLIIGGAIANSQPRYVERDIYVEPDYYPPQPRVYRRPVVVQGGYEPWSPSWYRYCTQRYRSFNPDTGTFMGYDGREHFCVAG